jgi:hypothetical protein
MRISSCGSAANLRLSVGCGKGRLAYLYSVLIRKGPGAFSHDGRPMYIGAFVFPGENVAFHRPVELAIEPDRNIPEGDSMKKAIWWFTVLAVTALSFSFVACKKQMEKKPEPAPAQKNIQPLFIIERSKNANVVHYDARLTAEGKLDPNEPVIAYWVLLAEDSRREELNWIEKKKAYGFHIKPDPSVEGFQMTLVSVPQGQITVRKVGDAIRAELTIEGHLAILEKIYISATDGPLGPEVHYIELYGKDLKTGEKRYQKIVKK